MNVLALFAQALYIKALFWRLRAYVHRNFSVLDEAGFAEIPAVLNHGACTDMLAALDRAVSRRAGSRNLLDVVACERLATNLKSHAQLDPLLPVAPSVCGDSWPRAPDHHAALHAGIDPSAQGRPQRNPSHGEARIATPANRGRVVESVLTDPAGCGDRLLLELRPRYPALPDDG